MALEFDDVLEELWGSGWYQKRLVYFLLCGIFFFTPFAFLNQVFVLHIPGSFLLWVVRDPLDKIKNLADVDTG